MNRLIFSIILFCSITSSINVFGQNIGFNWGVHMGGSNNDRGEAITIDNFGNVYTTGWYMATADFDPGPATYNLTSKGSFDIFISKLDSSGHFVWAKSIGGGDGDLSQAITVDKTGNIYTAGTFYSDSVDFDPGSGTYYISPNVYGYDDIFIVKLNPSGDFVWAKAIGTGTSADVSCFDIAVDDNANVYTTGYIQDTVDFDPGPNTYTLASTTNDAAYVWKLDSSGNFVWAKVMNGSGYSYGTSITLDKKKNVYTAGSLSGTTDFDPGPHVYNVSSGVASMFISKLDSLGTFILAGATGGEIDTDQPTSIAVDSSENIYTAGSFSNTVDFDIGPSVYNVIAPSPNSDAIFICKYNSSAGFVWEKSLFGSNYISTGLALDKKAHIYISAYYQSGSDYTGFIEELDSSSNILWYGNFYAPSGSYSYPYSIKVDANDNMYTTGFFGGYMNCDPDSAINNITSTGSNDVFVIKFSNNQNSANVDLIGNNNNGINIYPNPNNGNFVIETHLNENQIMHMFDVNGKEVLSQTTNGITNINASNLDVGVYSLSVVNNKSVVNKKLIIVR